MKSIKFNLTIVFTIIFIALFLSSCNDNILNESPLSSVNPETALNTKAGFEAYLIGLVRNAREEYARDDATYGVSNWIGTDVGDSAGQEHTAYRNWISYMTPVNSQVQSNWNWAYEKMIVQANT